MSKNKELTDAPKEVVVNEAPQEPARPAYQQRVLDEQAELKAKVDKLDLFLGNSALCEKSGPPEVGRMRRQRNIMLAYINILEERIRAF